MIKVQLDQGPAVEMDAGVTVFQALKNLKKTDRRLAAARVDGELADLSRPLDRDCTIAPIPLDSPEGLEILRHSAAHVMAEAVRELFPAAKVAIGPAIENGFYYDFDVPEPFTPEDLEKIEERMRQLVKQDQPFSRDEVAKEEALQLFSSQARGL